MNAKNLVAAFAPLIVFTVVGHLVGDAFVGWVALASAAIAVVVLVAGRRQGIKLITLASVAVFAGLAATALLGGPAGRSLVGTFGTAICALLIGALMLVSVLTVPFTEQYARATVPEQYWSSPTFRSVNKRISAAWGGAVVGIGLSRLVYGALAVATDHQVGTVLRLGLSWGIPIVLIFAALTATKKAAASADDHTASPSASPLRTEQDR